jgi:hypothetical protein
MAICKKCGASEFTKLFTRKEIKIERGFFGISEVSLEDSNHAVYQCNGCNRIFHYSSWQKGADLPYNAEKV